VASGVVFAGVVRPAVVVGGAVVWPGVAVVIGGAVAAPGVVVGATAGGVVAAGVVGAIAGGVVVAGAGVVAVGGAAAGAPPLSVSLTNAKASIAPASSTIAPIATVGSCQFGVCARRVRAGAPHSRHQSWSGPTVAEQRGQRSAPDSGSGG
jgi:hypothetical protein